MNSKNEQIDLEVVGGSLGPLSVEVLSRDGDTVADFALSSSRSTHGVKVGPGHYTVIARRPNGERLRQSVTVGQQRKTVFLESEIGGSPNEYLAAETLRGEVRRNPVLASFSSVGFETYSEGDPLVPRGILAGTANTILRSAVERQTRPMKAKQVSRLVVWGNSSRVQVAEFSHPASFLKFSICEPRKVLAIGLVDQDGTGPIVIVPPFRRRLDISFVGESLTAKPTDVETGASAVRMPVAVVLPEEEPVADLLAAIGSPTIDHAKSVWDDSVQALTGEPVEHATQMLMHKFHAPGEALLAAHYLLRFMPEALPLSWADNLMRADPTAADGPVIAAWARLSDRSGRSGPADRATCDREFQERIEEALRRPRLLFARSRRLLQDGLRLLPDLRQIARENAPAKFLDYGAHAGGLEAFWGSGPARPGVEPAPPGGEAGVVVGEVQRQGPTFVEIELNAPMPA
jgi:hypothetical protein